MALRFTFRDRPVTIKNAKDADPDQIGRALYRVATDNNGRLTTRAALDAARNRRNPLHRHLEWDNKIAAEAHRRDQMSEMIRLIVRADDADAKVEPRRAFLSIHDKSGTSYRNVDDVLRSVDLQLAVMQAAERDLAAWQRRYSELIDICDLVRAAQDRLKRKIDRATTEQGEARP